MRTSRPSLPGSSRLPDDLVFALVARIPEGKVATYGQIARMLGVPGGARAVGWAMARAGGRGLPCHRVVNRRGDLAPPNVFGGSEVQRAELEAEGVTFTADGRINVRAHLWDGTPSFPSEKPRERKCPCTWPLCS